MLMMVAFALAGLEDATKGETSSSQPLPARSCRRRRRGTNYTALGKGLGSMLGNNAGFMDGVLAIRKLECDDCFISAFLASVLEFTEATKQDRGIG
jgi:hypothetical protein